MKPIFRVTLFALVLMCFTALPASAQANREAITPDNAANLQELLFLPHRDRIINMDMAWSQDGTLFGLAGGGGVRLYRTGDNFELVFQLGANESKRAIAFNPDGSLVAGSDGSTPAVWLWDTQTGERVAVIDTGDYFSTTLTFAPDGRWFVTDDFTKNFSLWTVRNSAGQRVPFTPANVYRVQREFRFGEGLYALAAIPALDADHFYTSAGAAGDNLILLWNAATGEEEQSILYPDLWTGLDVNAERQIIAASTGQGDVILWGLDGTQLASFPDLFVNTVAFNPAGTLLATVSNDGAVRVYDIRDLDNIPQPVFTAAHNGITSRVAFNPGGTLLATMGAYDGVRFWGIGEPIQLVLPATPTPPPAPTATPQPVLSIGGNAQVQTTGGDALNVRSGPGRSFAIVTILANDTPVTLIDGPQNSDGFRWWKIRTADGTEGWTIEAADDVQTLIPLGS
ncbi:MAG: SH3 domain-containing protein [Anaerolineaceae bacterium]|nr:SH3 domain-containing protein [Anaerolineaceae bacterium]